MKAQFLLVVMVGLLLGLTTFVAVNQTGPTGAGGDDGRLAAIEERLETVEGLLRDVRETTRGVKRRVESAPRSGTAGAASAGAGGVGAAGEPSDPARTEARTAAFEEDVASRVESAVEAKIEELAARQRYRGDDGKWKPPMSEITRELGLDEERERKLHDIFDDARDEAFALLATPRGDGTSLLDDFADDIRESGDFRAAGGRFFIRLAKEQVPGRNETYLAAFGQVEESVRTRLDAQLDPVGRERLRALNLDVFDVKTGYDPVGEHIRARLGEQQ